MPPWIASTIAAVAGSTLTFALNYLRDRKQKALEFVPGPRIWQDSIPGQWEGTLVERYVDDNTSLQGMPLSRFPLHVEFRLKGLDIHGTAYYEAYGQEGELTLSGGFYDDAYMQVKYFNATGQARQFGVAVFRLGNFFNQVAGHYTGYSPLRGCFVTGTVELMKVEFRRRGRQESFARAVAQGGSAAGGAQSEARDAG